MNPIPCRIGAFVSLSSPKEERVGVRSLRVQGKSPSMFGIGCSMFPGSWGAFGVDGLLWKIVHSRPTPENFQNLLKDLPGDYVFGDTRGNRAVRSGYL